jgi:hypothetical protein
MALLLTLAESRTLHFVATRGEQTLAIHEMEYNRDYTERYPSRLSLLPLRLNRSSTPAD